MLCLALVAALYSNTSARNGQVLPAILGAVLALAVALWVSWRLVPRLAASVEWDWLPFLTQFRPTREGWVYVGSTLVVGATAFNTSNNLLYMILSALVAILLLSVFLSGVNFRSLTVTASVPAECFARQPFPMTITLANRKKIFPTFSIRVRSGAGSPFRFTSFYSPVARAGGAESRSPESACNRRGRHVIREVQIESRYPFGFFLKGGSYPVSGECIAFPEIIDADKPDLITRDVIGVAERFERGQGADLYMIRDYLTTDSARRVDWKASAKTQALKTREFTAEENKRVMLVFDRYGRDGDGTRFELLVSRAASLAVHLAKSNVEVGLLSDEWNSGFGGSEKALHAILRYLALVEMSPLARRPSGSAGSETLILSLR